MSPRRGKRVVARPFCNNCTELLTACRCHHSSAEAQRASIDAAGITEDRKGFLFRTSRGHTAAVPSEQPMIQSDAWHMIRRRAVAAGIHAPIGNHGFRAAGITAYVAL
jgi:hypothetical protein